MLSFFKSAAGTFCRFAAINLFAALNLEGFPEGIRLRRLNLRSKIVLRNQNSVTASLVYQTMRVPRRSQANPPL
jgi:hypothetical protein